MNFIISSTALSGKLASIAKVMSSKAALPILSTFLLELKDDELRITASDGDCIQSGTLEVAASNGCGKICITASYLLDALKNLPEQPVTFTIDETTFGTSISYNQGKYELMGCDTNQFVIPSPFDDNSVQIEVPVDVVLSSLNQSLFTVVENDMYPVTNGVFFQITEKQLQCAATDRHRLACITYSLDDVASDLSFILPVKAARILKSMITKTTEKLSISCNQREAIFKIDNDVLRCRLIEGHYPNYRSIIPSDSKNEVVLNRMELIAATKRVEAMCNKNSGLIEMKFSGMSLVLNGQDIDFSTSAQETILCQYSGEDLRIGFKADLFRSILENLTAKEITMKMNQSSTPVIIKPVQPEVGVDCLSLLSPMCLPN